MGLLNLFKTASDPVVVDMLSLFESLGMKGEVSPRTQLQVLRRLTRFAEREGVEVIAVLSGAPLHKAPKGKKFDQVKVLYSASKVVHAKYIARQAAACEGILLTNDEAVEKAAGRRVAKMRISTFRKAFDISQADGEHTDSSEGRGRRRRRPRRRDEGSSRQPQAEKKETDHQSDDAINELIDLVD
jgi:G3E family GTPase